MKTLAKIMLTLMVITMMSNTTFAENCNEIFVISKTENVENDIHCSQINKIINLLPKEKMRATINQRRQAIADVKFRELIQSMQQEEAEVNDLDFDTRAIFDEIMLAHQFELTPEILSDFIREENEVKDDFYFLHLTCVSPKPSNRTTYRTVSETLRFNYQCGLTH
jgi:hypothetical protein